MDQVTHRTILAIVVSSVFLVATLVIALGYAPMASNSSMNQTEPYRTVATGHPVRSDQTDSPSVTAAESARHGDGRPTGFRDHRSQRLSAQRRGQVTCACGNGWSTRSESSALQCPVMLVFAMVASTHRPTRGCATGQRENLCAGGGGHAHGQHDHQSNRGKIEHERNRSGTSVERHDIIGDAILPNSSGQ